MLARADPHSHTHIPLGLKQDSRGSSVSLSAAQMRLHISKIGEHHNEFHMGADEANSERLQMVTDMEQRPLKELREAQARHHKEWDTKEVCKLTVSQWKV